MPLGQGEVVSPGVRISDQKRAEEILERMWVTPNRCAGCLPLECWRVDSAPCFTNLPRQNDCRDGRTDKPDARNDGRRLIHGGVDFVIGSLREVSLRDRADAYHGAQ
jgi:hypothetical protein